MRALLALGILGSACGGGGGGGPIAPPSSVTGTYAVEHTFLLAGLPITEEPCTGTLEIAEQTGNTFSGTVTLDPVGECTGIGGEGQISGTLGGSQVSLTISGIDDPLAALQCAITGGDSAHTGTISSTTISVSRQIEGSCTIGGDTIVAQVVWKIEGTKT
ncbi:MAG: hypothetical protein H0W36_04160 [Gemmatimonadetes bacterium]|nr:hypothetical protein [Gemmatimonadota bacterium]